MLLLIKNIKKLVQVESHPVRKVAGNDMSVLNSVTDAYLLIKDDLILSFGEMKDLGKELEQGDEQQLP